MQEQYEEIFEVTFIISGAMGVGYRLFNEIFYGVQIVMNNNKKTICPINDYSCIMNRVSEFLYKPIDMVEALAVRKDNFKELLEHPMAKKMLPAIKVNYTYQI